MLVKSVLQERINRHKQDVDHAITAIHHALDKRGVTAFDHTNPVERSQAVAKTLEVSFELLRDEERARYQEFVIFPEDVDIPLQTLQHLWGKTGNLDEFDTEDLCMRFWSLSLLLHYNSVTQTVRLHDIMRNYLQYQRTPTELIQSHTQFIDTYVIKRWADLPQHEPYLWDHLAMHLIAANRASELVTTVTDGAYLASKAYYRPVSLLEQDLELTREHVPDNPVLSHLQRSISNMTQLHSCETWQECASVIHSRLVLLPQFQPICQSLEHRMKLPYLTTWHPLPDLPTEALKRTLSGHINWITACAISPDGTWLLSASKDCTLRIWDAASGQLRHILTDHTDSVTACAISPDGTWLLSASDDGTLNFWDAPSGKLRHTLITHTKGMRVCVITPNGKWFLTASDDGTLSFWNALSRKIRYTFINHFDKVTACAVSPDGYWLYTVSNIGTLKIWDIFSGKLCHTLADHTKGVRACVISPDGKWLLSASDDGTLRIWDVLTRELLHTLTGHTSSVNACAISTDGTWLLSASDDHVLKIWDAVTRVCIATLRVNGALQSCLFCGDRYHVVAGGECGVYFLRVVDDN